MKKLFKSLLMLLPMTLMVACANSQPVTQENKQAIQSAANENQVYLVIGKEGRYENKAGADVVDKFLEYTVTYKAEVGSALPGKDKVTSTVKDVEFVSWISYENMGKPTVYDKMPAKQDKILYAFYKSSALPGEGNEGGGENTDSTREIYVNNTDWLTVYAYAWTGSDNNGVWPGREMSKVGDYFKIDIPTKFENIIFTNNLGEKTRDLSLANYSEENNCFHIKADRWGKLSDTDLTKDPYIVYAIDKPSDWGNDIYCYAWVDDKTNNHEWPGVKMTLKDNKYSYTLPDGMYNVIFTDNNGHKTENLSFNPDVGFTYSLTSNTWSK